MPAGKYLILNEIAILALFALSLDLILGYAGIVSLGHAAFFGAGAYTAGLLAKHVTGDPLAGLALAIAVAAVLGFLTSFLVLRGSDLTRLMVTLGVALVLGELANALPHISGGADGLQGVVMGKLLGRFEFDLFGRTAYAYSLTTLFVLMLLARRIVHSPFGLSLMSIRRNALRAGALGVPVHSPIDRGLYAGGGLRGRGGRAAGADHGLRLARRLRVPSLGRRAPGADHRRRGLALWRHRRRRDLHGAAGRLRQPHAALLAVLDRPVPGGLRDDRPRSASSAASTACWPWCGGDERRPGNPRPRQALRRTGRHQRRHVPARARRAPGADRAQRRGQDDVRQPADRGAAAVGRTGAAAGRGRDAAPARGPGAPRPGADLPDQPAVRRSHAARDAWRWRWTSGSSSGAIGAAGSARSLR